LRERLRAAKAALTKLRDALTDSQREAAAARERHRKLQAAVLGHAETSASADSAPRDDAPARTSSFARAVAAAQSGLVDLQRAVIPFARLELADLGGAAVRAAALATGGSGPSPLEAAAVEALRARDMWVAVAISPHSAPAEWQVEWVSMPELALVSPALAATAGSLPPHLSPAQADTLASRLRECSDEVRRLRVRCDALARTHEREVSALRASLLASQSQGILGPREGGEDGSAAHSHGQSQELRAQLSATKASLADAHAQVARLTMVSVSVYRHDVFTFRGVASVERPERASFPSQPA